MPFSHFKKLYCLVIFVEVDLIGIVGSFHFIPSAMIEGNSKRGKKKKRRTDAGKEPMPVEKLMAKVALAVKPNTFNASLLVPSREIEKVLDSDAFMSNATKYLSNNFKSSLVVEESDNETVETTIKNYTFDYSLEDSSSINSKITYLSNEYNPVRRSNREMVCF